MRLNWIEVKHAHFVATPGDGWTATVEQDIDTGDWVCGLTGPSGEQQANFAASAELGMNWCEEEFMTIHDRFAQQDGVAPAEVAPAPDALGDIQNYLEAVYDRSGPDGLVNLAFSSVDDQKRAELAAQAMEDPQAFIEQMVSTLANTPNALESWSAYIVDEPEVSEEVEAEADKAVHEISNDDVIQQVAQDSPDTAAWLGFKSSSITRREAAVRRATKVAVDQETKDYWTTYYGQYGFEFTRDLALLGQKKMATLMGDRITRMHKRLTAKSAAKLETIWIVTKPSDISEMVDICWDTDLQGLARQFVGGLKPEDIVAMFDSESEAVQLADKLLAQRQGSKTAQHAFDWKGGDGMFVAEVPGYYCEIIEDRGLGQFVWQVRPEADISEVEKSGTSGSLDVAKIDCETYVTSQQPVKEGAEHVAVDAPTLKYITDYYTGYGAKWTRDLALGGQKIAQANGGEFPGDEHEVRDAQVEEVPDQWVTIADGVMECDFSEGSHGAIVAQDDPKYPFQVTVVRADGGVVEYPATSVDEAQALADIAVAGLGTPGLVEEVVGQAQINATGKAATTLLKQAQMKDYSPEFKALFERAGIHCENVMVSSSGVLVATLMLEPEAQKLTEFLNMANYKDVEVENSADRWFVSAEIPGSV